MKSSTAKSETSVLRDIASTVHVIVQTSLIDGRHIVDEITEVTDVVLPDSGTVQMQPIFKFDRMTRRWKTEGRPSDKLTSYLAQRGVPVENRWFNRGVN